jgi:hypothetical protein
MSEYSPDAVDMERLVADIKSINDEYPEAPAEFGSPETYLASGLLREGWVYKPAFAAHLMRQFKEVHATTLLGAPLAVWADRKGDIHFNGMGARVEPERRASSDWLEDCEFIIHDPDGWDRAGDFDKSWSELITWDEFMRRAAGSTTSPKRRVRPDGSSI